VTLQVSGLGCFNGWLKRKWAQTRAHNLLEAQLVRLPEENWLPLSRYLCGKDMVFTKSSWGSKGVC
jgi:hypothetical protein